VICAPSSPTRFAMSCREISTLSSAMGFDNKLGRLITHAGVDVGRVRRTGFLCEPQRSLRLKAFYRRVRKEKLSIL
jgi:hypothetical protein